MRLLKFLLATLAIMASSVVFGQGQITVTAPTDGQFLGATNNVSFAITGAIHQVTVTATITGAGGSISSNKQFIPDANNKVTDSLPLNLDRSLPDGPYVLTVTASEVGNVYNTPPPINVTVLLTPPKFLDFNPISGSFVRGIVPISASFLTANIKDWRVQVNGQDIPNNTGSTNSFTVNWDTTGIPTDGAQTITITVRDLALNTASQTINVTLDRLAPSISVQFPRSDTLITAHTPIPVLIDIQDASTTSVDVTGIDVIFQTTGGQFILRVPRISARATGSNTLRWNGRIRATVPLPSQFVLVVTAVDKAGNMASTQQIQLRVAS